MSASKLRKLSHRLHPGRGSAWGKKSGKGVRGVSFYTASDRQALKSLD